MDTAQKKTSQDLSDESDDSLSSSPAQGRARILVVDDEHHVRMSLVHALMSFGYIVYNCSTAQEAVDSVHRQSYDILLTDLMMPDMDGMQLLSKIRKIDPTVSVVMMTAHGSIETAVEAMKLGADDYLLKPMELNVLEILIQKIVSKRVLARENRRLTIENHALKQNIEIRYHLANMLGTSPKVQALMKEIKRHSKVRTPVLLLGEPGCQLGHIAQILHYNSPWKASSLIEFNCGIVPLELHDVQLFGAEEAMDSGMRIRGRPGLVEKAHQGTLILSDINQIEKKCQHMVSHSYFRHQVQRTGGTRFYEAEVRIIGTSHEQDIHNRSDQNLFRWDLWDKMRENTIIVPALRERIEDLPILLLAESKRLSIFYGKTIEKIEPAVIARLSQHRFPGNYRELEALVEAAVIRSVDSTLRLADFSI